MIRAQSGRNHDCIARYRRWDRPFTNPDVKGWKGYDPDLRKVGLWAANLEVRPISSDAIQMSSGPYHESVSRVQIASDHALLPFGAGERKCVGDQFAVLEAAVTIIMLLRRFDFELAMDPVAPEKIDPNNPDRSVGVVGMKAAATIHTAEGLFMRVKERFPGKTDVPPRQVWPHRASSHLAGENDCHCE